MKSTVVMLLKKIIAGLSIIIFVFGVICFSEIGINAEENEGTWSVDVSKDEFGDIDYDSRSIIKAVVEGTFSNTATSDSSLSVGIVLYNNNSGQKEFDFQMYEYGKQLATYTNSDNLSMKIKVDDIKVDYMIVGDAPNGALRLGAIDYAGEELFSTLYYGNDVKVIIKIGSSEYKFTIPSDNFAEICTEAEAKDEELADYKSVKAPEEAIQAYFKHEREAERYQYFVEYGDSFEDMTTEEIEDVIENKWLRILIEDSYYDDWWVFTYKDGIRTQVGKFVDGLYEDTETYEHDYKIENNILYEDYRKSEDEWQKGFAFKKLKDGYYYAVQVYGDEHVITQGQTEPYRYLYVMYGDDGKPAYEL